jgi:fimbrial isopeptide formation D2 family protein/LPXTG-motif cell wall-anchored protein
MKHIKRAAALVLAVMLSLCLSLTAFAATETSGTLTVTGKGLTGKTVTAIRMFTANVNDGDEGKLNGFDSYSLEDAWLGFFKDASRIEAVKTAGKITDANPSNQDMKDAAVAYVKSLDDTQLASLAHDAQKWVRDKQNKNAFNDLTAISDPAIADTTDSTKGVATIANLTSGYYLVFPEMGSTGNAISKDDTTARGTDAMLVNIPKNKGNTAATIKSTYPTVDKKVQTTTDGEFKTDGNAQIGDKVTYQLTATVPDMTDYDKYTFKFVDTLTKGLSYIDKSVNVKVGDTAITDGYTATYSAESKTLTVAFDNLKTTNKGENATVAAGDVITVTYNAYITADAAVTDPATNTVHLEYSTNPDGSGKGESTPSESKVYTYPIEIFKFYKEGETEKGLANATFKLSISEDSTAAGIELVKDTTAENSYHVKGEGETSTTTEVTTPDGGKITIRGLKAGTYYLHEITAPTGFNKLTHPVKIEITADENDQSKATYKIDNVANTGANSHQVKVENMKGTMLPETGSFGTIGLTILGVAVVLLGVFAPKKKKENR